VDQDLRSITPFEDKIDDLSGLVNQLTRQSGQLKPLHARNCTLAIDLTCCNHVRVIRLAFPDLDTNTDHATSEDVIYLVVAQAYHHLPPIPNSAFVSKPEAFAFRFVNDLANRNRGIPWKVNELVPGSIQTLAKPLQSIIVARAGSFVLQSCRNVRPCDSISIAKRCTSFTKQRHSRPRNRGIAR
jgi:hypothetical protein